MDEARFKGLQRQYRQQHPGVPSYVVNQMYNALVSPGMKNALDPYTNQRAQTPSQVSSTQTDSPPANDPQATAYFPPPGEAPAQTNLYHTPGNAEVYANPGPMPQDLASSVLKNRDALRGAVFTKKPQTIALAPWMLEDDTLMRLRYVRFGLNPRDNEVRNDTQRHALQQQLADQRANGDNEPIILIRQQDGKYELIDGYHRLSAYLLRSAPPQDMEGIRSGDFSKVDFRRWKPVVVKAYIGVMPNTPNPYIGGPSSPPPYTPMPEPQTTVYQSPPQGPPQAA